jgi:hypothetical protein
VTSNPHAKIYVLKFVNNKVTSRYLEYQELSGDYNETLQEIFEVPLTVPKWVEKAIRDLYRRATRDGVTAESIETFKTELEKLRLYPQFRKVATGLEDKDA